MKPNAPPQPCRNARWCLLMLVPFVCLALVTSSRTRESSVANLDRFASCLHANHVQTAPKGIFLVLPKMPTKTALDRALGRCRRYTGWPPHYGTVKTVSGFLARGTAFSNCMRSHGYDTGKPQVILGWLGIGVTFTRDLHVTTPSVCERILERH